MHGNRISLFALASLLLLSLLRCELGGGPKQQYCGPSSDLDWDCGPGWICLPYHCPSNWRCVKREHSDQPEAVDRPCVVDGVCDPGYCETAWTCPQDCALSCTPANGSPVATGYLARDYSLPATYGEADQWPLDLDRSGGADAKFGPALTWMFDGLDILRPNEVLHQWVTDGSLLLALRPVRSGAGSGDATTMVQVLAALSQSIAPSFDGSDVLELHPDASTDVVFCLQDATDLPQQWIGGYATGPLRIPVPHFGPGETALLELHRAYIVLRVDEQGRWLEAYLGGGLRPQDLRDQLYPPLVALFGEIISADPEARPARLIAQYYDGACFPQLDVAECPEDISSAPECSSSDTPPVITLTEVVCNIFANGAVSPDLDPDFDGQDDLISFGVHLPLVGAIILQ